VRVDWKWLIVGYLIGSFFGFTQLLGIAGGFGKAGSQAGQSL
jgi:hypothetical protein